jgi:hypothetical protein
MLNYDTKSWSKEIQEHNLAKSGYKPNMKYKKTFSHFSTFWLDTISYYFFGLTSGDWKHPKKHFIFFFSLFREISPLTEKKRLLKNSLKNPQPCLKRLRSKISGSLVDGGDVVKVNAEETRARSDRELTG